ncbi:MAG: tRNA (adenosine(37)-N6)-dimethylallyltransferase MiaA [Alphaproteobacteria bacterium]|nr:tRNA (adenosine(37)-N6)-dimethylallyltransferase MiaA [Alphaproteobacteria bacterium]
MKHNAIIIAGPTASGKSEFAHKLAKRINGAIINADSVQIYRGIENISASPFAEISGRFDEIDGVPYKLFSILSLNEHISVADYLALAKQAFDEVVAMGKVPIFVGGTGYYINVLINGISQIPEVCESNRNKAREMVAEDIESAKKMLPTEFVATDPQRIARALEVFLETGKHITDWQKKPRDCAVVPDALRVLIMPERADLLKRIASRIPEMIKGGALEEGANIIKNNLDSSRAIGAVQICDMLRGKISENEAIENWTTKTNQYAKRQRTWFNGQYNADIEIKNVPNDKDLERVIEQL